MLNLDFINRFYLFKAAISVTKIVFVVSLLLVCLNAGLINVLASFDVPGRAFLKNVVMIQIMPFFICFFSFSFFYRMLFVRLKIDIRFLFFVIFNSLVVFGLLFHLFSLDDKIFNSIGSFCFYYILFILGSELGYYQRITKNYWHFIIILSGIFLAYFINFVFFSDLVTFRGFFLFIPNPQLKGDLMVSTEFANIVYLNILCVLLSLKETQNSFWIFCSALYLLILFVIQALLMSLAAIFLTIITVFILYEMVNSFKKVAIVMIIFLLFSLIAVNFGVESQDLLNYYTDFTKFIDSKYKSGGAGRADIWSAYFDLLFKDPVGYGNLTSNKIVGYAPHNNFLSLWVNYGILGIIVYCFSVLFWLCSCFTVYRSGFKNLNFVYSFYFIGLTFLHFKGFVQDTWSDPCFVVFNGALIGLKSQTNRIFYYNWGRNK